MRHKLSIVCVALSLMASACVSDAEGVTGLYDGEANFISVFGSQSNSNIFKEKIALVPLKGEAKVVVFTWFKVCRAEAVVTGIDLEVNQSSCTVDIGGGETLRFNYRGQGDVSDSGRMKLDLSGSITYIDANASASEGTFTYSFSGRRD
jgi:hypothetical protein